VTTGEVGRFSDHHRPNAELAHEPAAVPTGRKRCDHHGVAIVAAPAGVAEGAGFGVSRGVTVLDATVVAPAEQLTGPVEKGSTDWDTALIEAKPGFFDGHGQHGDGVGGSYRIRVRGQCHRSYFYTRAGAAGRQKVAGPLQDLKSRLTRAPYLSDPGYVGNKRRAAGDSVRPVVVITTVTYRAATADDAVPVARLHADSWRRHYRGAYLDAYLDGDVLEDRRAVWAERLRQTDEGCFTIVADRGDEVVGFAHTVLDADPEWGALLDNLHVRFDLKRNGVGRALTTETAHLLRQRRPSSGLYLWVLKQNTAAQAFYSSIGGLVVEERLGGPFPGGGRAPTLRYAWPDPAVLMAPG
jgi:ribosomal protein S18 acetylase RimI-like enzyme